MIRLFRRSFFFARFIFARFVEKSSREREWRNIMNEVIDAILSRRSVRNYKPDMVEPELIEQVLQAGTYAANGKGRQAPIILAVTNRELRDRLSNRLKAINMEVSGYTPEDPFYGAPVVLIVLADKNRPTYLYDGSLVMGNMMLAAHSLGLGTCWIHRAKLIFEQEEGKQILADLGIEGDYEGIGHCILGYPDVVELTPAPRKADYIHYIR